MRLVGRQYWTMATLAQRLHDQRHRLDELQAGDQQVRASIALSYEALDPLARVAARRLGMLGLPDFPSWVIAAVLDVDLDEGERVLERLLDGRFAEYALTDEHGQERYQVHDLLRLFAAERAVIEDEPAQRKAAIRRVICGWLQIVNHIAASHPSGEVVPDMVETSSGQEAARGRTALWRLSTVVSAADRPQHWFSTEQHALITSVEQAAALQLDDAATLAIALSRSVFATANLFQAWARTHDAALTVVRHNGNRAAEAALLTGYGQLRYEQDRFAEARTYYLQALAAFREIGDRAGEAATLAGISAACREQGYLPEALHFLAQARELLSHTNDVASLASVARLTGTVLLEQGDFAAADTILREALAAFREIGGRRGEARTLRTLGLVHRAQEHYGQAFELCAHARAIFRDLGDELLEAYSVQAMAKAQIRLGRHTEALHPLLKALHVCRANADRYGEALCLRTVGELQLASGDLAEAHNNLHTALHLWRAMDLPLPRSRTLRDLARIAIAQKDLDTARTQLTEAEQITRLYGAHEHTEICDLLTKLQNS
jgi:tetratricopeptide (TPR) repeat protein